MFLFFFLTHSLIHYQHVLLNLLFIHFTMQNTPVFLLQDVDFYTSVFGFETKSRVFLRSQESKYFSS